MSSGNYMLFRRGPWWEPAPLARARVILDMDKRLSSLGSVEQVKNKIEAIFPEANWTLLDLNAHLSSTPVPPSFMRFSFKGAVWFGNAGIEFQLDQNESGEVRSIHLSRANPSDVRKLKRGLRLVSMNLDADSFFGILFS